MERMTFSRLPALAQAAVGLSLVNSWVLIAEFVIDRYGIAPYLPLYRVGDVCVWDVAVATGVIAVIVAQNRREA